MRGSGKERSARGCSRADAAVSCCRRAFLMRVSYGGMRWDQALLKGACLAWGERCGHYDHRCRLLPSYSSTSRRGTENGGITNASLSNAPLSRKTASSSSPSSSCSSPSTTPAAAKAALAAASTGVEAPHRALPPPPPPPRYHPQPQPAGGAVTPFGYMHESALEALRGNSWMAFVLSAHAGTGMPEPLRLIVSAHIALGRGLGGGGGGGGGVSSASAIAAAPAEPRGRGVRGIGGPAGEDRYCTLRLSEEGAVGAKQQDRQGDQKVHQQGHRQKEEHDGGDGGGGGGGSGGLGLGPILRETDAILSGVDFHCSGVLDEILQSSNTAVVARVLAAIRGNGGGGGGGDAKNKPIAGSSPSSSGALSTAAAAGLRGDRAEKQSAILAAKEAAKQAMWACSGGVNARKLTVAFAEAGGVVRGGDAPGGEPTPGGCSIGCVSSLVPANGGDAGVLDTDAAVWAAISADVLEWTRRFVRGRLAPGGLA